MCSINGFTWDDKKRIQRMVNVTKHRGPDDNGIYTDSSISLGHARLSIIDLTKAGHQPMQDDHLIIVYNGELYNYKELKIKLQSYNHKFETNTDTEVVLKAFKEYGTNCLQFFNGMFAFAIYNSKDKSIFLARDRVGIKPLYYCHTQDTKNPSLIFASEIKAILEHDIPRTVNTTSLTQYLKFGYTPSPNTMFNNISKLPPSHYALYKDNKLTVSKYHTLTFTHQTTTPEQVRNNFKAAVERHMMSDVPLGAYLSGGIDSSAIVAMMAQFSDNITTFSVGFDSDQVTNELPYAKQVAEEFKTNHTEITVTSEQALKLLPIIAKTLDEPINNPAAIPLYEMAEQAKHKLTVVLTGNGGDELYAGYRQHALIALAQNYYKKAPSLIGSTIAKKASELLNAMTPGSYKKYTSFAQQLMKTIDNPQASYESLMYKNFPAEDRKELLTHHPQIPNTLEPFFQTKDHLVNQLLAVDLQLLLPENYLMVDDKINMAHGIESRVPFLDKEFIQFSLSVPPEQKVRNLNSKIILKEAMKDLPKQVLERKKYGFTPPVRHWIQEGLKDHTHNLYENKDLHQYFNKSYIDKVLTSPQHDNKVFPLAIFAEWHGKYFK